MSATAAGPALRRSVSPPPIGEAKLAKGAGSDVGFTTVLVTGEMRSGTTFVANLLNSQAGCTVYADFLKSWFREPRKLDLASLSEPLSARQKNVLLSNLTAGGWQFGISKFDDIDREGFSSFFDLFQLALQAIDAEHANRIVGVKITRDYEHLDELLELGVRVIFCLRDPRDVLISAKNRFSTYNLFDSAMSWRDSLEVAERLASHEGFCLLRFESIVEPATRAAELRRLSRFLGVELTEEVGKLTIRDGVQFVANSSFGDVQKPFDTKVLGRWKSELDSDEVVFASRFLQNELRRYGYDHVEVPNATYLPLFRRYVKFRSRRAARDIALSLYRRVRS